MCWHHDTGRERGDRGGRSRSCILDPALAGCGPKRECPEPGRYPRALCFACWTVGCSDWESALNTPCDLRVGPVGGAGRASCRSYRRRAGASDQTAGRSPFRVEIWGRWDCQDSRVHAYAHRERPVIPTPPLPASMQSGVVRRSFCCLCWGIPGLSVCAGALRPISALSRLHRTEAPITLPIEPDSGASGF